MAEGIVNNVGAEYGIDCIKNEVKSGKRRRLPLSLKSTRSKNKKCVQQVTNIKTPDDISNKTITRNVECNQNIICSVCKVQIAGVSSQGDKCLECRVETSEKCLQVNSTSHYGLGDVQSLMSTKEELGCIGTKIEQIDKDNSLKRLFSGATDTAVTKITDDNFGNKPKAVLELPVQDNKIVQETHMLDDISEWLNDDFEYEELDLDGNMADIKGSTTCRTSSNFGPTLSHNSQLSMEVCQETDKANHKPYKQSSINRFTSNKKHSSSQKKQTDIGVFFGLKSKQTMNQVREKEVIITPRIPTHNWNGRQTGGINEKRKCPFYKKVEGTSFAVDAFSYGTIPGISHYFLSHFHYDHYGGLKRSFAKPIYCSQVTANLILLKIKVANQFVHPLLLHNPVKINNVEITLLEANHCPGAVMFIFKLPDGKVHLHSGDFRASPLMETNPFLRPAWIHTLYLDTTYCNPAYSFPPQSATIDYCVSLVNRAVAKNNKTLIVVGAYTIGKEKIFVAVADVLQCKVAVRRDKYYILQCLEWKHLREIVTQNYMEAQVHVLPMADLTHKKLVTHLKVHSSLYHEILAIKPTGWTFTNQKCDDLVNIKPSKVGPVTIHGVPYSEHSSYKELENFVKFIKPSKIIPTVNNGSAKKRDEMFEMFRNWLQK